MIETNYCLTLDKIFSRFDDTQICSSLISEMLNNKEQLDEWIKLFSIDELEGFTSPLTEKFLRANDKLILDTKFFSTEFKYEILSLFDNLDEECTGLLINSENFQALNLMLEKYREKVHGIHIDPPYNTKTSGFLYKNQFKHSSWLSLMSDRLKISLEYLNTSGNLLVHIDENEYEYLFQLITSFNLVNFGTLVWDKRNPMNGTHGLAIQHEYLIWFGKSEQLIKNPVQNLIEIFEKKEFLLKKYDSVCGELKSEFSKWIKGQKQLPGGLKAYSLIDETGQIYRGISLRAPEPRLDKKFFVPLIHPLTGRPCPVPPNGFSRTPETLAKMIKNGEIIFGEDDTTQPQQKKILTLDSVNQMTSIVQDAKKGKATLDRFGLAFPYCHPVSFYSKILNTFEINSTFLDYFAGSGTTGHAVIELNREDQGNRKFILVEMGKYFNTVLKPRIQKVIYSKNWKNGKPVDREGISSMFKYSSLESYEDTLNNLDLKASHSQLQLISSNSKLREEYMLSYMLDLESKESLIRIKDFANPFNYKLKIIEENETKEKSVDLIETFNYLLGFNTETLDYDSEKGVLYLEGKNNADEKILIIWRDLAKLNNEALNEWFSKRYSSKELEHAAIYVNGDNNLENLKLSEDRWKLRLIESEFHRLMFDTSAVEAL